MHSFKRACVDRSNGSSPNFTIRDISSSGGPLRAKRASYRSRLQIDLTSSRGNVRIKRSEAKWLVNYAPKVMVILPGTDKL